MRIKRLSWLLTVFPLLLSCQALQPPPLSKLSADASSPLYTTYAAARERSEFTLDEGYHLQYYMKDRPVEFTTDSAGDWGIIVQEGERKAVVTLQEYASRPVISLSYPDMVRFTAKPYEDLELTVTFVVHSSQLAVQEITLRNLSRQPRSVRTISYIQHGERQMTDTAFETDGITFSHNEPPDRWVLDHNIPHVSNVDNFWIVSPGFDAEAISFTLSQSGTAALRKAADQPARPIIQQGRRARTVGFDILVEMKPMASRSIRMVRGVARGSEEQKELRGLARVLLASELESYRRSNEQACVLVPELHGVDEDRRLLYWSAWSMMRQLILPAEGSSPTLYYVFSREPQWGWGHAGQVFHESLTMLAYAHLNPVGAMESQRLYALTQGEDGYIHYRTGPYLREAITVNGERTCSAPWYAWQNWEIYRITRDREFLEQMYASSKRFYRYYTSRRDADGDGLYEWGGHAVLESVRDARVAVWNTVAPPNRLEAVGLNSMLVQEGRALAAMARELELPGEAELWHMESELLAAAVRTRMWDEETGFFYHIDRDDDDFSFRKPDDLKRKEIVGLLPLWAGIATDDQAARIVREHLTNPDEFWRPNGIPSLSADDPYFNPKGYWNGPVWVQWNYLVFRGLIDYGYHQEAIELSNRVSGVMIDVLKQNHNLWEFYSPDEPWGGWHAPYIWAGIVNRMLLDASDLARREASR